MKRSAKKIIKFLFILLLLAGLIVGRDYVRKYVINRILGVYYVYKGDRAYHKHKLAYSIEYYNKGLEYFPSHYTAWYNLGNIYVVYEDYYSAVEAYKKAIEVSDFYKENLQKRHFVNSDNLVYTGLDSGWNSFSEEELKSFVAHCKANGQAAGVYWTPFTDWGKNPENEIKDAPGYKYKDVYLYANGKPQELDGAYAIDPTHPAVETMMKKTAELFHRAGFEYVKMDFMTHGAMESDKWYKPEIRTGIQAYNYGMRLLDQYFGDMYINLSISPIFPAHYAQSRRIACDAWNKIKDTEYTLNALSYGWWLDEVYQFNDPDHIVLRDASEGENRARVTSGVITGVFIAGDDFSLGGSKEVKDKAMKYLTNPEINAIANGESFRPLEGNGEKSENQFVRIDKGGCSYYAVFNYTDKELKVSTSFERLGLDSEKKYKLKELWSGKESFAKNYLEVMLPACDAAIFKIEGE